MNESSSRDKSVDVRPTLNNKISIKDLSEFYWLKKELVLFCKQEGLSTVGSKTELTQRIILYLKTGHKTRQKPRSNSTSKFDWKREVLSSKTIITDNYKNTENVRHFFLEEIGSSFKFNVKFMNWLKRSTGLTLGDAVLEYHKIKERNKLDSSPKNIEPQFEYNRYLRDFLADNVDSNRETGIRLWKIKKSLRGNNNYVKSDLEFLKKN